MLDLQIGSYLLPEAFGYAQDRIEYVGPQAPAGVGQWAVRSSSLCLSRDLEWDHEPQPSSSLRTTEWYRRHRFGSAVEAYAYWRRWARRLDDDGR